MLARKLLREKALKEKDISDIEYHAPINIRRLVKQVQENDPHGQLVEPMEVIDSVKELTADCVLPQFKKVYTRDINKL